AGRVDQRTATSCEAREFGFECFVGRAVTTHEMRSTTAGTIFGDTSSEGFFYAEIVGETEIVVRAEVEQLASIDSQFSGLRRLDFAPHAVKLCCATRIELGPEPLTKSAAHGTLRQCAAAASWNRAEAVCGCTKESSCSCTSRGSG